MLDLIVAGDVRLYCEGVAGILSGFGHLRVLATTSDQDSTRRALTEHRPDVLLLDMAMPHSLSLLREISRGGPAVVALALPELERTFLICVEAGMASYVTRDASVQDLVEVIEGAVRGESDLPPRLAASLMRRVSALSSPDGELDHGLGLTQREGEVAALVAEGKSNKRIASELHVAVATVKHHVHNILAKMGASRRSEITARWVRRRMPEPPTLRARRELHHLRQALSRVEDRS